MKKRWLLCRGPGRYYMAWRHIPQRLFSMKAGYGCSPERIPTSIWRVDVVISMTRRALAVARR